MTKRELAEKIYDMLAEGSPEADMVTNPDGSVVIVAWLPTGEEVNVLVHVVAQQ